MTHFELAAPNVVAEKFQEGLVILNLDSGMYFDAGDRLVPVLRALEDGVSVECLKAGLERLEPGAGQKLDEALTRMTEFGLLRPAAARDAQPETGLFKEILSAGPEFHIEGFSDLAELIAADPIHDVHPETGRLRS